MRCDWCYDVATVGSRHANVKQWILFIIWALGMTESCSFRHWVAVCLVPTREPPPSQEILLETALLEHNVSTSFLLDVNTTSDTCTPICHEAEEPVWLHARAAICDFTMAGACCGLKACGHAHTQTKLLDYGFQRFPLDAKTSMSKVGEALG